MPTIEELRALHPKYKKDNEKLIEVQSICDKCKTQTYYKPGGQHFSGCPGLLLPLNQNAADQDNKKDGGS